MDKSKIIILYDAPTYFNTFFKEKGFSTYAAYKKLSIFYKIIRNIYFRLKFPKSLWFDIWKDKLAEINTVIIFSTSPIECVHYIKSVNPEIRIIYWYWNPIFRSINPNTISNNLCEKWSFDLIDCKKFNLEYNTSFYFNNIILLKTDICYDIVYLGLDKGRRNFLEDLKNEFIEKGLRTCFYIVDDNATHRNYKGTNPVIEYDKYLSIISKSKSILDYVQKGQTGLSLRPMESIFFKKKLITNDESIRNHDFYLADNIFILGFDDINVLSEFLKKPYKNLPDEITVKYDVDNWVQRFLNK